MKSLKLVLALVILGGFAATCQAEYVETGLRGTGIVEEVRVHQRDTKGNKFSADGVYSEPEPGSGWVVWTVEVKLKDVEEGEQNWDGLLGGFVSDQPFWNRPEEDLNVVDGESAFHRFGSLSAQSWYGTEFLLSKEGGSGTFETNPRDLSNGSVVKLGGAALGGGQLSVGQIVWFPYDNPEEGGPALPAPVPQKNWFALAQLIVPASGAKLWTVGTDVNDGKRPPLDYVSPLQFWNHRRDGSKVVGTIVPEPSSMVLVMVVAGFVGLLASWRRRRRV